MFSKSVITIALSLAGSHVLASPMIAGCVSLSGSPRLPSMTVTVSQGSAQETPFNVVEKRAAVLGGHLHWIVTPMAARPGNSENPVNPSRLALYGTNETGAVYVGELKLIPNLRNAQTATLEINGQVFATLNCRRAP